MTTLINIFKDYLKKIKSSINRNKADLLLISGIAIILITTWSYNVYLGAYLLGTILVGIALFIHKYC